MDNLLQLLFLLHGIRPCFSFSHAPGERPFHSLADFVTPINPKVPPGGFVRLPTRQPPGWTKPKLCRGVDGQRAPGQGTGKKTFLL